MKHILKTLSFHWVLMVLFFQELCSAWKPALAFAMRALMSLCVLVSSVMMTPRYVTRAFTLTSGGWPVGGIALVAMHFCV